jgi:hypothetical protein
MVKKLLHLEGLVFFLVALYLFHLYQGNWWLFLLFIFVPDISMIGYFKDRKLGAIVYNLVHNYILGIVLLALGALVFENALLIFTGIIIIAHVGMDRFFGYGLKYQTHFKDTHLQKV